MNEKNTLFILGGGIAGLAAGYFAKERGLPFFILEPTSRLGGVYGTHQREIQGQLFRFDTGLYRFHFHNAESAAFFQTLLNQDLLKIKVEKQVFFNNNFIDLPLTSSNLQKHIGNFNFIKSSLRVIQGKLKRNDTELESFQDFAIDKYGQRISEAFFLNYAKKYWGLPAHKLSLDIANERINPLGFNPLAVESLFRNNDKKKESSQFFHYSKIGFEALTNTFLAQIEKEKIIYQQEITAINISDNKVISIEINDNVLIVEQVISTFPLPQLAQLISPRLPQSIAKAIQELTYRNIILFVLYLDVAQVSNNSIIYFPEKEYAFTRVFEPKNQNSASMPKDRTVLIVEIPSPMKRYWKNTFQRETMNQVLAQLAQIGLININDLLGTDTIPLPLTYPVLSNNYETPYQEVINYFEGIENLHLVGQSKLFNYTYLDEIIRSSEKKINNL